MAKYFAKCQALLKVGWPVISYCCIMIQKDGPEVAKTCFQSLLISSGMLTFSYGAKHVPNRSLYIIMQSDKWPNTLASVLKWIDVPTQKWRRQCGDLRKFCMDDHWRKFFERSYLSKESRQRAQTNRYGDNIIELKFPLAHQGLSRVELQWALKELSCADNHTACGSDD